MGLRHLWRIKSTMKSVHMRKAFAHQKLVENPPFSKVLDKHEALEAFEGPVSFPKKQIRAHERADFMHRLKIKGY